MFLAFWAVQVLLTHISLLVVRLHLTGAVQICLPSAQVSRITIIREVSRPLRLEAKWCVEYSAAAVRCVHLLQLEILVSIRHRLISRIELLDMALFCHFLMHKFPAIFQTLIHRWNAVVLVVTADLLLPIAQLPVFDVVVVYLAVVRLCILVWSTLQLSCLHLLTGCLLVSNCSLHLLEIVAEILPLLREFHLISRTHSSWRSHTYMASVWYVCLSCLVEPVIVDLLVVVLEVELWLHLMLNMVLFELMWHCVLLISFHIFKF